jgi:ubiquinone/menaquinone biosynthesis C-methylase UbiE
LKRLLLVIVLFGFLTGAKAQWKNKYGFCGAALKKSVINTIKPQAKFLNLQENDTLVDIGASSGWFQGALANVWPAKKLHFVLVDIDSACLNEEKLANMTKYYSGLKGSDIDYEYELIVNTEKSLGLSGRKFSRIMIRNTLHEIDDRESLAKEINELILPRGELYIMEVLPTEKRKTHGGCKQPLMSFSDINSLFEKHGFYLKEKQLQVLSKKQTFQLLRFVKRAE